MVKMIRVLCLWVIVLSLACSKTSTQPEDNALLERIQALPDVEAISIGPYSGYAHAFVLKITQPANHRNPGGQTFVQRVYLMHAAEAAPMSARSRPVLIPESHVDGRLWNEHASIQEAL